MGLKARWFSHLKKIALLRLGLDLINQSWKVTILGAFVKKIMVFFVLVSNSVSSCICT